jgi:mevalonate kinase
VDISPFLNAFTLILINAHTQGKTKDLVSSFLRKYEVPDFMHTIDHEYIPVINRTIETILSSDFEAFDAALAQYSRFQLSHFEHLIPPGMRKYFEHGIESGVFHLKICGSGGGGYFLGISRDRMKAETYFNENHLEYLIV